jgi:hypothetical protein
MRFRINYTCKSGRRSYTCGASDAIDALTKLAKNRADYGDKITELDNIDIRKLNP